jgi:hypothetical protein
VEEADAARAQARRDLEEENAALPGKIRELRRQQGSGGEAQHLSQKIEKLFVGDSLTF